MPDNRGTNSIPNSSKFDPITLEILWVFKSSARRP
jgi:hypothetical protein